MSQILASKNKLNIVLFYVTTMDLYHNKTSSLSVNTYTKLFYDSSLCLLGHSFQFSLNQTQYKLLFRYLYCISVVRGNDPNVSVVLLEDMAAVTGVTIAATCLGVSHFTGSPFADSLGSIMIGGLLGVVATFIITTNTHALVGRYDIVYISYF